MQLVVLALLAGAALATTLYVHWRLPVHVAGRGQTWAVRALLVVTGVGLGYLGALAYREGGTLAGALAFVVGLGVAHVPAAFILFIKRERGEYGRG